MSSYKNNKDGTLSSIATNNHITQITQPEQYVTEAELVEGLSSKQDIIQYATLPTASSEELGNIYQYVGATTADYTHGYVYECVTDGTDYSWERIDVQPSGGSGGTSDYTDLTNKPQVEGVTLVGNKTASDLGLATAASLNAKQDKIQFTTMPTASAVYLDKIVQFVGTTTANYTYGYFYKCVNNGGVYGWERVDVQPSTKGKVVVIGDSYFVSPNNYNFANYLTSLGVYDKVSDYAEGGTGFGVTYEGTESLYTKLQNSQMRADVAEADIIFMHLGGNDCLSRMTFMNPTHEQRETDLYKAVKDALNEIYTLNPEVTVYYIYGLDYNGAFSNIVLPAISGTVSPFFSGAEVTRWDALMSLDVLHTINTALMTSNLNIYALDCTSTSLISAYNQGDIHPTADAATHMFQEIVKGDYIGFTMDYMVDDKTGLIYTFSPSFVNDAVAVMTKLMRFNRVGKTFTKVILISNSDPINFSTIGFNLYNDTLFGDFVDTNTDVLVSINAPTATGDLSITDKVYKLGTAIFNGTLAQYNELSATEKALYSHIAVVGDGLYNTSKNKIANLGEQIQYSTVPTASATLLNNIIQYVGTTNANYTNGYFYKCISDGGNPATYGWERVDIQPNVNNYTTLTNKPQIEGITLSGNKSATDLGLVTLTTLTNALATKQDIMQVTTMPTASVDYVNQVVQYIGTNSADYINGYFYKCTSSGNPATYAWTRIDTQPNDSGHDLPTGGTTGQVLAKHSNSNYDVEWTDVSGASGVTRLELDADYEDMGLIHDISEYESIGVVNVKDYGAVGDGVTDDSAAIIAAGTAASQFTPIKPIIYFPRGTYNLNGATIYTTSEYTLAGESKDFVTLTNSNIRADYGINCRDITFDGGTLRDLSSSGLNQALRVNTVIILCLPVENQDIEINYYNCEFKNAQIASLAYAYNESTKRISSMTVEGCYFHDLEHCGIYHTCDIGIAKISNNKFKNLGSDTLLEGSFACVRLGDTSNNTPADVDACYILNNEFDTFQSGYDYSGITHNIAFNMLMIEAWEVIVTNNIFKNLLGWGGDREAVYTKARYVEISDNIIINGCCGGEGAIACKPRHFDAYSDRNTNIHDNTIIAPWGNGIAVYGAGSVFNNKISIAHISRAIRCYGNGTGDENSIGTMDICNNNIVGGIGNLDVNGTTVNYPAIVVAEGATPPTTVPIISATDYPYKVTINDNTVCVTRDDGLTVRPIAIACENMRYDIDVKYNNVETSYVGNNAITVGSNSSSKNPVTGRKNLNINIEGNSISDQSTPIYMNLSGNKIASQRKIVNVINNSIRSTTSYPTIIQATPNGNDIVIYRTIYNTNTQSGGKKHLYVKDMKYIYVEDAQYVTIDNNSVTPYEIKLLDVAPVNSIYNSKALIDNVTVIEDANLLHVPDGEYSGYGLTMSVKDNIMTLNGTNISSNLYVKLTNGVEVASASIPTAWKSETVDFMSSGGTYGLREFVFGGATYRNTIVSNVRDSDGNILMSYARTNPQTLSTTPAFINLYIPRSAILVDYKIGVSITPNTIAKDWGSFVAYHDYWKQYISHFTLNTNDFIVPSTGERYTQGMCSDGTHLYISAITNTDTDNTIIYKYNLSDGTLVDSVNSYSLGHCNSMTYCSKDNKIYCIALDTNGQTIHKINTDLTYDSSFTVNLTPFYSASTGVGAISYNAKRNQFVCLIRGTQKGFAIFDTHFNLLDIVWTTSIYNQNNATPTYASIFADDDFIYQVVYAISGIYVFTWQGELVGKVQIPDAFDITGSSGSTSNPELEDLEIVNGYGYINYTEMNTKKISVAKLNILDKRYACVMKK